MKAERTFWAIVALCLSLALETPVIATAIRIGERSLKAVALNHVVQSAKALAAGSYPYFKSYDVSIAKKSSPLAHSFVDFVLSPRRESMHELMGHWVAA